MREIFISILSFALTGFVLGYAYYTKRQFYPSVVFITKSNPSMAVIYLQSMVFVLMMGKLMKKIFLGTLRATEFEHLMERFWYALTETCLAFTVFRDDFNPKFIALFTVLLFLKSFHWLAEDRVDYMERSPVIGWLFHARAIGLVALLSMMDYMMISHAYYSTLTKGPSVQLVFGFEYAILLTLVINTTIKYGLHAMELRLDSPWENKAVFLLYTELIIGFIRVILYVLFVIIMVRLYTLPLFAFRPMYYAVRNFKKALNDVILSRRAIQNMNTLYPDATPEELQQSDNICIICREDMVSSSKKLPCGHIFHTICLRSWFQRQQTCPTCRLNILRTPVPAQSQPVNAAGQGAPPAPGAPNTPPPANATNAPASASPAPAIVPGTQPPNAAFHNGLPMPTIFNFPMPGMPPFPTMAPPPPPFLIPPPPIPPGLDRLSEEELRLLEGTERRHVEERIKFLRNVQTLLDASSALMNQYQSISLQYPIPVPPPVAESTKVAEDAVAGSSKQTSEVVEGMTEAVVVDKVNQVTIRDVLEDEEQQSESERNRKEIITVNSSPSPNDEAAELRRRRLERFSNPSTSSAATAGTSSAQD